MMRTILVDDELWSLEQFKTECLDMPEITVVGEFNNPLSALEFAKENRVDFALLDIEMPLMNGIELGKNLRLLYPDIVIVFVTGYDKYVLESMKLRADYYVLKPYCRADIEDVLRKAKLLFKGQSKHIFVRTFGYFDVFVDSKPIIFSSAKAKELLAILVDKNGGVLTCEEAFTLLWEDKPYDDCGLSLYRKVAQRLKENLERENISNLVVSKNRCRFINKDVFDCDYYQYLEGIESAKFHFNGEYMTNYSWSETTLGKLVNDLTL